ncbi:MAG: OB-fold nucleic acid binding domain-containing protein [Eubacteriales bacterium]|nr:OB-fold nucleic acid binding domain-containing protein [Eubacteriales bacterium]
MEQQPLCNLAKDQRFEGFVLVRSADQRTGGNGSKYLDLNLADRTGEVNAKVWDGNVPCPAPGTVVKVRGTTLEYNGRLQMRIEKIRSATDEDAVDMSTLTPCAPKPPEEMLAEIEATVNAFTSEPLQRLTREMLRRFNDRLLYYPAAQRIHHAERSGLLHHTTGMLGMAKAVIGQYPWLNADLLYAGVILHDLCKTEEMDSDAMGVVRDYTKEGLLLGHLVLGVTRIQEVANDLGIAGEPVLLLQHMMLSHHGEAEYGSPRKPMFPEAEVLHWVDLLDARMNEMQNAVSKLKPGVFSEKIWSLDRRLYNAQYEQIAPEESIPTEE